MAEAVAGLLTSAFVNVAKDMLASAIGEQANLLWNFDGDLEDMMDTLDTISAKLEDAENQSVKEKSVRLCLKRLKDAAIDISDILEDYQDTTDQATAKKPIVLSCLPTAYKKIVMANRMKTMREKLSKISKEFQNFGFTLSQGTSTAIAPIHDERETASNLLPDVVEGRDGHKREIIKLLLPSTNRDESETVIVPICGLGGMGKSTLAQLVYNDDQIINKYGHRVWVYVSQDFNPLKIGRSIISQLQVQRGQQDRDHQNSSLQVIQQCLDGLLDVEKKVLIVLDDLWERDDNKLRDLKRMLHVNKKGGMVDVILTTRNEEIVRKFSSSEPYSLQPLIDYECWEIIKRTSKFDGKSNQEELKWVGLDIAKKCGGVPLAANALGYMLQSKDLYGWKEINSNDTWNGTPEDRVLQSLMLSYQNMQPQLKICFSYCATFSKGHNIVEDDLIHQWSALDFIEPSTGKEYIKQLLGMSFLQFSKLPLSPTEHVLRYTMHDLVHDLARLIVGDELIICDAVESKRNAHAHKYCRYSLLTKYNRTMTLSDILPSKMRVLRFLDNDKLDLPRGAFSFAKRLRTLDFSACSGISLPSSIGPLKQLRCLIARRIQNKSLPKFITDLPKLQYLDLNGSCQIALPESLGNLGCLKYLDLSHCYGISELPESLCGLTQLQYLNLSWCDRLDRLPEAIGSLVDLQYLIMSYCSIRKLPVSLTKLQNLSHLDLSGLCVVGPEGRDVLGNITSLKYLSLSCCGIRAVDFIGTLTNLEHLDLSFNDYLGCLPESIGNLKRLHNLDLTRCSGLKSLPDSIHALGLKSLVVEGCSAELIDRASSPVHHLQTLPYFKVRADDVKGGSNLHLLEGAQHASELTILTLENASSLEDANKAKLVDKHNLKRLTLEWTVGAARLVQDKDLLGQLVPPGGLKHMHLQGYSSTSFPGWLVDISRHLANLVSMELENLPKCTSLPALGQLPHLGKLVLARLPSIKKISMDFCGGKGAFPRLVEFSLQKMEGLEEWTTRYSVDDGAEVFMLPVLDRLVIRGCPNLMLKSCPPTFRECAIVSSEQVLSSLEELHKISHHPCSIMKLYDMNCQSMEIFHQFSALQDLRIIGCANLTSLPESMRHLTSLRSLMLHSCDGISALPEWLGELSSLNEIVIQRCESIKSLPSCIHELKELQKLGLWGTPELKKWCESEENKTKLAHINIRFYVRCWWLPG